VCSRHRTALLGLGFLALLVLVLLSGPATTYSQDTTEEVTLSLIGWVTNTQDLPVDEAEVRVFVGGKLRELLIAGHVSEVAHTSPEGFCVVDLQVSPDLLEADTVAFEIRKPGFRATRQGFARQQVAHAGDHHYIRVPDVVLPRIFNPAFFIATYIGSAPNIVAAGILDRAGYRLKLGDFSRVGVPVTFVTLLVPTIWILIRYFWLKF
jgi:hypothetical protein